MAVDSQVSARARAALGVLTDLTPSAERRATAESVPLEWFRWLDTGLTLLSAYGFADPGSAGPSFIDMMRQSDAPSQPRVAVDKVFGERLAAVQQLREGRHAIRIGWLWLAGSQRVVGPDGQESRRRIFQPLVSRTVRIVHSKPDLSWVLMPYGDLEITPLVSDRAESQRLEHNVEFGGGAFTDLRDLDAALLARLPRLAGFARDCAAAAGFRDLRLVVDREQPDDLMRRNVLQIVVGLALYTTDEPERTTRAGSLLAWQRSALDEPTAFHAVYAGHESAVEHDDRSIESPLPLTPLQAHAVQLARSRSLTVVSGAPGTGKSHTLVSIVSDSLRRGESVLIAAKNDAAVDALIDLMARQPGITPVVFGSSERRTQLAQRLASGELQPADQRMLRAAQDDLDRAIRVRDGTRDRARATLRWEWARSPASRVELDAARQLVPAVLGDGAWPAALDERLASAGRGGSGWWARRRRARAMRRVRSLVGAPPAASDSDVLRALQAARPPDPVPPDLTPSIACADLVRAEDEVRSRLAAWLALETRSESRLDRSGLAAVGTLATALRSGRSARRTQLERLRDRSLTKALPVWMGTLGDVDDLLPPVPGLFDLVLIDEASATEQTAAASALLRACRAVVVGDPRQLRHVSFLSDDTITAALDRYAIDPADRSQLDVRRNSVFDAAATACPVMTLDEHFRSAPHLIDVVARSLYGGQLHVATRTPISECIDCVSLTRTSGAREKGGLVQAEIDAVLVALRAMRYSARSVGVLTPFRAQADALEAAILASFGADELVRMGVRVGTVHSFQGNERDAVLCSVGLVDGDAAGWAFVGDPHLLAVMLTRARTSMTVISSCSPDPASLLGQYVAAADSPPGPPPPVEALSTWAAAIAADLRLAGVRLSAAYPAGRHVVDIATVAEQRPLAIVCDLHPEGVDAHIDRLVALQRAGWQTVDALASLWDERQAEMVADIARYIHTES